MNHNSRISPPSAAVEARALAKALQAYRGADRRRSLIELAITLLPFLAFMAGITAALQFGLYWLYGLLLLPAALFLVRLFMIQHDCSHGAFFQRQTSNEWTGRILGVLTLTPYDHWRRTHTLHHAGTGNLERRGVGDIRTLTVDEYRALPWFKRAVYRVYRHPAAMFIIGPIYHFIIQNRFPDKLTSASRTRWLNTMGTNVALAVLIAGMSWAFGWQAFLMIYLPVMLIAGAIGVWLFYVQHQFETTHWEENQSWNLHEAALHGSSHYDLPIVLRWFTANIGVHHVHHLCSRIPFYRLPQVLKDYPHLRDIGRVSLWQSFALVRLSLWDPHSRRLISFREFHRLGAAHPQSDKEILSKREDLGLSVLGRSVSYEQAS